MSEVESTFHYATYPADGIETRIRTVGFGPASDKFAILVEMDPVEGEISITVGNGPSTPDANPLVANILRDFADTLEEALENPEFIAQLSTED